MLSLITVLYPRGESAQMYLFTMRAFKISTRITWAVVKWLERCIHLLPDETLVSLMALIHCRSSLNGTCNRVNRVFESKLPLASRYIVHIPMSHHGADIPTLFFISWQVIFLPGVEKTHVTEDQVHQLRAPFYSYLCPMSHAL